MKCLILFISEVRLAQLGVLIWVFYGCFSSHALANTQQPELFKPVAMDIAQAKSLFQEPDYAQAHWVVSRKYDGVRAFWDGAILRTKQGKRIYPPADFLAQLPEFPLDGELWLGTGKFHRVSQMVLSSLQPSAKENALWQEVHYKVFEVPNMAGDLFARIQRLAQYLAHRRSRYLSLIVQQRVTSYPQLEAFYQQVIAEGGEGVVMRDASQPYQVGRLSRVIKIKPKLEAECLVSGYVPGKGRLAGLVGAIECRLLASQKVQLFPQLSQQQPTTIRLGSGLSDTQRRQPPEIGAVLSFQYNGHTQNGLPRFAVFLRQRYSAVQAQQLGIE